MSIKYYPPSILICYPASFGGCVRIPLQKMTNIPMAMVAIWGVRRPACNEDADKKEHPRRKTKGTHSFIDRLYWICLRSTPYTSCLALPSLFPSDFQLSNCWSRASGFLFLDYASVRRTQPQRNITTQPTEPQPLDLISFILLGGVSTSAPPSLW